MAGRQPGPQWRQIGPVFIVLPGAVPGGQPGVEEAAQAEIVYSEHKEWQGREVGTWLAACSARTSGI